MSSNSAQSATWRIDPAHTLVEFSVRHLMISTVKGRFAGVKGTLIGDITDLSGVRIEAAIDASSIQTQEDRRDEHLRSADFFETEKYPEITFVSTKIEPTGDGEYNVQGDLTIRGITQSVSLATTFEGTIIDQRGNEKAGLSAEGKLSRKAFGLEWNPLLESGGVVVGDQVKISLHAELAKQAAE